MPANIKTGSQVNIKIVKQPTNAAAQKTLVRLLSKDDQIKAENKRLETARAKNLRLANRGGRKWAVRVVKQHPVKGRVGETGTIKASYDVIKDLQSVERFIEIS